MLTDAPVEKLAETLAEALADTLSVLLCDLVTPNKSKHCLVSFYFGNTYTGKQRSRPRPLCDKN